MTRLFRTSLLAVLAAAPLAAQQPAAACSIDFSQPKELLTHYTISRAKIISMPTSDARAQLLRDVMKTLGTPKVIAANPQGVSLFTGQMLIAWLTQPGMGNTATRAQLGWGDVKDPASIDIAKVADSIFTAIEKSQPACSSETRPWRESKPWQDRINAALRLSATNVDSAEIMANASMVLNRAAPYAERVLASVAQSRNNHLSMLDHLDSALVRTVSDTNYADDRRAVLFQIGQTGLEVAETQPEPARTQLFRRAVSAMETLATESPSAEATPYAITGLGMAASALKDSSLFVKCVSIVDGALDKFSDLSTLQAAVCASMNKKKADAARLFDVTLKKNPYSRDALYNSAVAQLDLHQGAEMLATVKRLVALEPSNPDNISLFAYAYNSMAEATKDPKAKKVLSDTVAMYMKQSDDMPHRVAMSEFTRYADKAVLRGDIENRSKVEKSYVMEVEFLDAAGDVLDKQSATVGPVAASKTGTFSLTSNKPKIASWRYAPLK